MSTVFEILLPRGSQGIEMKRMWKCKRPMSCGVRPAEVGDCTEPCDKYKKWHREWVGTLIVKIIVVVVVVVAVVYSGFAVCNNGL